MLMWIIFISIILIVAGVLAYSDFALFAAGFAKAMVFLFLALFVVCHLLGRRPYRWDAEVSALPHGRQQNPQRDG